MKSKIKKKVLIFIITYKAEERVLEVFKKINLKTLKKYNTKILISDDCSKDMTALYCNKIKKKFKNVKISINNKNLGYGGNIKKCLHYALKNKFKYAVMIHGDGQYSPIYIDRLLKNFQNERVHAVTGSRIKSGILSALKGGMPLYKLIGNLILTTIFNLTFNTKFKDAHTGLWSYKLSIFKKIQIKTLPNNFNFDQILRIKMLLNKFKIKEIPIKTIYADERSQLHIIYAIKFLLITILYLFKFNYFFNKYKLTL